MSNNKLGKKHFDLGSITKEELIQLIKSSANLNEAAKLLGTNRRTLGRVREKLGIVHIPCNSLSNKKELVTKLNKKDLDLREKLLNTQNYEETVKVWEEVLDEKNEITPKDVIKAIKKQGNKIKAAEFLNISLVDVENLIEKHNKDKKKSTEPENPNLKTVYEGRFKEKSDLTFKNYKKFVITSVQNDTDINEEQYKALKNYCKLNNAKLLILPVYYMYDEITSRFKVDESDLFFNNVQLNDNVKVLNVRVSPTIVDPFAGLDPLSKGDSIVIPHPQVAMKTIATLGGSPAQMYTTGSLSLSDGAYLKTKTGLKAEFNHSNAALVVELGNEDSFYARFLNVDEYNGFYDYTGYYTEDNFTPLEYVEAIYLGDTHVGVIEPKVVNATWKDKNSMVNVLKPKYMIHGDALDFSSRSHHDDHDYLTSAAKAITQMNNVEDELNGLGTFLRTTKVKGVQNLIDASNHNEHFTKWLATTNPKTDLVNAKIYHKMCYLVLDSVERVPSGVSYSNALELWFKNSDFKDVLEYTTFLDRRDGYKIKDIEISMHGDKGPNGSRGSPTSFSKLPTKSIVGHSHSPSIRLGCYTVGTSSMLNLSYNSGASSWMHAHCIIYPNGKRQMINIINGKWHG